MQRGEEKIPKTENLFEAGNAEAEQRVQKRIKVQNSLRKKRVPERQT